MKSGKFWIALENGIINWRKHFALTVAQYPVLLCWWLIEVFVVDLARLRNRTGLKARNRLQKFRQTARHKMPSRSQGNRSTGLPASDTSTTADRAFNVIVNMKSRKILRVELDRCVHDIA
jgi:hypothetical protein